MTNKSKLIIDKNGSLTWDGKNIAPNDITEELITGIFKKALKQEVLFEIEKGPIISILFEKIKTETSEDSSFFKEIKKLTEEIKQFEEEVIVIEK